MSEQIKLEDAGIASTSEIRGASITKSIRLRK